jgi:hypothetical protein
MWKSCQVAIASKVSVVVDPEFGFRLADQVLSGPVWILDTPVNRAAFEKHWAERKGESHLEGVTSFSGMPKASSEDLLINEMDMIDLHHGRLSSEVPYSVLEVLGTPLTPRIETALREFEFVMFEKIPHGFRAARAVPESGR